jgi:ribonuclease J
MANRDNRQIRIVPGDTVVISATPIPGNEHVIDRTIDNLFKEGATVLHARVASVHVAGHGSAEELKLMLRLINPRFFVPIHGEYRHLITHARLATNSGVPAENVFIAENGHVLEFTPTSGRIVGKVPAGYVYVDGLTVGDVDNVVLRDRRVMSQDGIVVAIIAVDKQTGTLVGRPDVVSRGFIYPRESEELMEDAREVVAEAMNHQGEHLAEWGFINSKVKDILGKFLYEQTRRRPMILPVVVEV